MARTLGAAIVLLFFSQEGGGTPLALTSYTQEDLRSKTKASSAAGESCEVHASARHRTIIPQDTGGTVVCKKASGDVTKISHRLFVVP